ncbi:tRNA uridine-5-carboxymethylaminomethyl(34) synthesis GTPase MnmE [Buchnera aphidicola]|uniref:tRNA modification GTPase MnmE n=1 Tax=Buchnera aphidicola (Cinara cf. splendens/pseudotsugae 3390) TaxID=2518980 RepID=A0A451CWA3_9GAMM|nr:tRNA uridine-5-carboxymethylaminomethyl(34) synthesis GTPase MnmE [Buchnera aphidicola]VFP77583.1 tRNA modification GTPase MnmE [Buchnera aphidicola (Cinara cf. splendens/pseudotsugae 3390)]
MIFNETIVAPATAFGRSGIGIIRISGSSVLRIMKKFLNISMKERFAHNASFLDFQGNVIDHGIALFFSAPKSFTGEDILEFQGHGNPILLDIIIENIVRMNNVRLARPGEFSERAFLNKKIDLIQAEAISDLINAQSKLSIQASLLSLSGSFSRKICLIIDLLKVFYSQVEATINFSDEIDSSYERLDFMPQLTKIIVLLKNLTDTARKSHALQKSIKIVIAGLPNVGKSSLFNYLSDQRVSIVTDIPGTTRDLMCKDIWSNGICYELMDTAGLRKSQDVIENIGIQLAEKSIRSCDHVFFVLDTSRNQKKNNKVILKSIKNLRINQTITFIFNKIDLTEQQPRLEVVHQKFQCIYLSVKKKLGLNRLKKIINTILHTKNNVESVFLARRRHVLELEKSLKHLMKGKKDWYKSNNVELLSENIRLSMNCLLRITGHFNSDDLLNKIFSDFCIGK